MLGFIVREILHCNLFSKETLPIEEIDLPIRVDDKISPPRCEVQKWPMMDPHRIVQYLVNNAGLVLPLEEVAKFWQTSRANREPWALGTEAGDHHIPLGIYGDSATLVTKYGLRTSVAAIFISLPLWRPASLRLSRFMIAAVPDNKMWYHHTLLQLYRRIVWSLNALFDNQHPTVGPAGEPLPEHLRAVGGTPITTNNSVFVVTEVRGDWSWHKKVLRYEANWNAKKVCFKCDARSDGRWSKRYYNFDDAEWIGRSFNTVQFLSHMMPSVGVSPSEQFEVVHIS